VRPEQHWGSLDKGKRAICGPCILGSHCLKWALPNATKRADHPRNHSEPTPVHPTSSMPAGNLLLHHPPPPPSYFAPYPILRLPPTPPPQPRFLHSRFYACLSFLLTPKVNKSIAYSCVFPSGRRSQFWVGSFWTSSVSPHLGGYIVIEQSRRLHCLRLSLYIPFSPCHRDYNPNSQAIESLVLASVSLNAHVVYNIVPDFETNLLAS
jgi:hypothetical protein